MATLLLVLLLLLEVWVVRQGLEPSRCSHLVRLLQHLLVPQLQPCCQLGRGCLRCHALPQGQSCQQLLGAACAVWPLPQLPLQRPLRPGPRHRVPPPEGVPAVFQEGHGMVQERQRQQLAH
jgi:hypothetical protein